MDKPTPQTANVLRQPCGCTDRNHVWCSWHRHIYPPPKLASHSGYYVIPVLFTIMVMITTIAVTLIKSDGRTEATQAWISRPISNSEACFNDLFWCAKIATCVMS